MVIHRQYCLWKLRRLKYDTEKILILFDDAIADMKANKILSPSVSELFLRGK